MTGEGGNMSKFSFLVCFIEFRAKEGKNAALQPGSFVHEICFVSCSRSCGAFDVFILVLDAVFSIVFSICSSFQRQNPVIK